MRAPAWQRSLMTLVAGYEVVALWSPLPTITNVSHRHPWLAGAIVGSLAVHFQPRL